MSKAGDIDHVIRHVTVRQLLEADQMHSTAPFKIEGKEFKKVCATRIGRKSESNTSVISSPWWRISVFLRNAKHTWTSALMMEQGGLKRANGTNPR